MPKPLGFLVKATTPANGSPVAGMTSASTVSGTASHPIAARTSVMVRSNWQAVADRIDGACPMAHPTTAEVLQWAANKWGINPVLLYAEAVQEGDWDNTSLGDNGTSSGVLQVADRGSSHAFLGFSGAGQNLSRENTCFNGDFYAGHLYAVFHGMTGEAPAGDIGAAIQAWYSGYVTSAGAYTQSVYGHLTNQDWVGYYFGGQVIPY
jgi:hypothetical protein